MDGWVHVDAKTVPNTPDPQILLKAVFVAIFGQNAEITLAKRHLVVAGSVVGYVSVGDVLNMTHNTVEYLGYLNIGLIISRDDLAAWPILSLVIRNLQHMLR